ncbi:uncharacterized protein LOC107273033 [Cephus cinctus]|uniref:Uncharacterized protein LOC107273033 n=1 Tax=Cephus cinctus TaxID=211228 RepID=A0AAJ7FSN2_CEPCN|nr:uncharacterized protein LOC107273033 [Cephus cinctus]
MKTLKAKLKAKKNSGKFSTIKCTAKDASSSLSSSSDLSELRKPIDISTCSLLQVTKLLDTGSDEIQNILAYECDIIYECRICKSLFRSLVNFISHKRVYCKEKYNIFNRKAMDNIVGKKTLVDLEPHMDVGFKENESNERMLRSQVLQKDSNLDLTSVMDIIQEKKCEHTESSNLRANEYKSKSTEIISDNQQILLEALSSSQSAVYQTVRENTADLMKAQIIELQKIMNKNTAVLGPNGRCIEVNQVEKTDNNFQSCDNNDNIEISDANATDELICPICKGEFATKKTLAHHVKSQHTSYKMIYSCPCCPNSFRNTWSVYRHLYKVHKKSNEQVRKLRNQIQDKAYRKVCIEDQQSIQKCGLNSKDCNQRKKLTDENQEWMNQVESDAELQRCGGCGRRFDRKAALQSHLQLCQRRIAVCNGAANKAKKSGKIPSVDNVFIHNNSAKLIAEMHDEVPHTSTADTKSSPVKGDPSTWTETESQVAGMDFSKSSEENELSIRVDEVSTLSTADWEMLGVNTFCEKEESRINSNKSTSNECYDKESCSVTNIKDLPTLAAAPDSPEILYTRINASPPNSVTVGSKRRKIDTIDGGKEFAIESEISLQQKSLALPNNSTSITSSTSTKSSTTTAVESSFIAKNDNVDNSKMDNFSSKYDISRISNIRKLQCLKCRRKFSSITNLRRHMAIHMGWNRYSCALCDFKSFVKCDCLAHCNKVHDAKNNQGLLEQIVVPISQVEGSPNQPLIIDIATMEDASADPEIITTTAHQSNEHDHSISNNTTHVDKVDAMKKTTFAAEKRSFEAESNSATLVGSNNGTRNMSRNNSFEETQESLQRENESESDCNDSKNAEQERSKMSPEKLQYINNRSPQFLAQSTLDKNPDLKRMVMEVIFGTVETADVSNSDKIQIDPAFKIITEEKVTNNESMKAIKMASMKDDNNEETLNNEVVKEENDKKDQESSKKDDSGNKQIFNHDDQPRPQRSMRRIKFVNKKYSSYLPEQTSRSDNIQKSVPYSLNKSVNAKLLTDKIPTVVICRADTVRGLCNIKKII